MATKLIEYIGPLRAYVEDGTDDDSKTPAPVIEIVDTGQAVTWGVPIEVDAAVAGRPPKGDDPGEGLLAQTDWRLAKTKEPANG